MDPPKLGTLISLCDEYVSGRRKFTGKPEEETKQFLIEPLVEGLLGWPKAPDDDYNEREFKGDVKGIEWKDVALIIAKKPRIFIESKACNDKNIAAKYAEELLTYLKNYNANKSESEWVTWGILTNFTMTYFYHWSEPVSNPSPFYVISYQELPAKIEDFKTLVSPEGVRNNRLLNRYLESPAHKLDEYFLQDLKKWRKIIANGFFKANQSLTLDQISELSHVFLSRFIFIRRLEAIGVLPPHWLKNQYEMWKEGRSLPTPTFAEYLRTLVKNFWRIYDTELFEEQDCDRYDFEDSYFEDLLKYIKRPSAQISSITGIYDPEDRGLYGYKFGELTLDVLGTSYEKYLAHKLEIKTLGRNKIVTIEETAELRQREGAYYTPSHIVKLIISQTLQPRIDSVRIEWMALLEKREYASAKLKIRELSRIKIIDPAAGSGSFLVEAYNRLVAAYNEYNSAVSKIFEGIPFQFNQTTDYQVEKVSEHVLIENIFGVDLDPKAVEITKLNLWLHHIDFNQLEYQHSGGLTKRRLLPALDLNIQTGNSLVDGDSSILNARTEDIERISQLRRRIGEIRIQLSRNQNEKEIGGLLSEEIALKSELDRLSLELDDKVNAGLNKRGGVSDFKHPFNWSIRFPEIMRDGGFDVYIGNPPYINLYSFSGEFRDYLSVRHNRIFRAKNDILYHFYLKGVELLKKGGTLGYITSRYFLEAENSDLLREYLSSNVTIRTLIDYGNVELFKGVNTRCVVMIFENTPPSSNSAIQIGKVKKWLGIHSELTDLISSHLGKDEFYANNGLVSVFGILQTSLGQDPWRLLSPKEKKFKSGIEENSWKLGGDEGIVHIGMGMQTGFDKAFRITRDDLEREHIPTDMVRKLIRNGDIRRFATYDRDEYWIYTEDINIDSLPKQHPVRKHLEEYVDDLRERYPCRICGHCSQTFDSHAKLEEHWRKASVPSELQASKRAWYQYTVPNMKEVFSLSQKLVVPYKAPSNRFALDEERRISSMDVYVMAFKSPETERQVGGFPYLLSVLNSSLMDYVYINFYGRRKKSEFEYYTGLLEEIPIRKPSPDQQRTLVDLAITINDLHKKRAKLIQTFTRILDAVAGKTNVKLKHYYDDAAAFSITGKERLGTSEGSGDSRNDNVAVYKLGVEEEGDSIYIEADYQLNSQERVRTRVLKFNVSEESVRRFLLYAIKANIDESRKKKVLGRGNDILKIILENVHVPRLRISHKENVSYIKRMMSEFQSEVQDTDLSRVEHSIFQNAQNMDDAVYNLYGLAAEDVAMLTEMYRSQTVSEYFDRLEEYIGIEDIQE